MTKYRTTYKQRWIFVVYGIVLCQLQACLMLPPPTHHQAEVINTGEEVAGVHIEFSEVTSSFGKQSFMQSAHTLYVINTSKKPLHIESLVLYLQATTFIASTGALTYPRELFPKDTLVLEATYREPTGGAYNRDLSDYVSSLSAGTLRILLEVNNTTATYYLKPIEKNDARQQLLE